MKKIYLIMTFICMMMVSCKPDGGDGRHQGHEYVDLGLSVKWATRNVGANSPEDYGEYFACGETTAKAEYCSDNCPAYGLSASDLQSQGYIDDEGNFTPQCDAATANWGGDWRMPTCNELKELMTSCTMKWTKQKGVNGYKVEGPNGNSIFLPAAAYHYSSQSGWGGGFYWSSTPSGDDYAYSFYFYGDANMIEDDGGRYYGYSVRPVLE